MAQPGRVGPAPEKNRVKRRRNRFTFTPLARADVLSIREYVSRQSHDASERIGRALEEACARLARTPGVGHRREELGSRSLRVLVVHSYLVVYRPESRPLQILRVIHGSRDLARAFRAPLD